MTCRRDRLPSSVPGEFMCKRKTAPGDKRARVARFNEPITIVKIVNQPEKERCSGLKDYERVHVSFQSTSSCNLSTVNALNRNGLYARKKEKGRGENKRRWGIEMNDARDLYLRSYFKIDSIDHLIQNCKMSYRSWKYWHSPMLHAKGLATVVAYDLYLECAEGLIELRWRLSE